MRKGGIMKILHVITSLELGGAEKLLTELIPAQISLGHTVELFILSDKNAVFLDNFKKKNIPVHVSKYNSIKTWKNMFEIKKCAKKGKFDIVHSHLTHGQYWTSLASRIDFGKRIYITTEHSTSNNRREKFIFKIIDRIYCKNETLNQLKKKIGIIAVGAAELSDREYELISGQFQCICEYLNWDFVIDEKISAWAVGDLAKDEKKLSELKELWRKI